MAILGILELGRELLEESESELTYLDAVGQFERLLLNHLFRILYRRLSTIPKGHISFVF